MKAAPVTRRRAAILRTVVSTPRTSVKPVALTDPITVMGRRAMTGQIRKEAAWLAFASRCLVVE